MTFLTRINPLSYGVDMLRGVALRGVNVTGASTSILSKIPSQVLAQLPPQVKTALTSASSRTTLVTQRYPLWLDVTVVAGFSILMLFIAIWQFSRQA